MKMNPIVREVGNLVMMPILLFAFYVQFHGDYGPGGGFQAGVIFASAFILHSLIYGIDATQRILSPLLMRFLLALGVLLYAGTGVVCMLKGGNFLDFDVLTDSHGKAHNVHAQELGILWVEAGVGIAVASVMIVLFFSFAGRRFERDAS